MNTDENVRENMKKNLDDKSCNEFKSSTLSTSPSKSSLRNTSQRKLTDANNSITNADPVIFDSLSSESASSFETLPTQNDSDIIEKEILSSKRLTKKNISNINILKDDGTIITGYAMAYPKRNKDFHNFFKEIPHNEYLVNDFSCALHKEILNQGKMFVSLNYIGFHSNIFGWVQNFVIPFSDVTEIEKKMTAFVIPNAIQITTKNAKYFFSSFLSRDSVYELLVKSWDHSIFKNLKSTDYAFDTKINEKDTFLLGLNTIPIQLIRDQIGCNEPKSEDSSTQSTVTLQKEDKVHDETVCDCLNNKQHFDKIILDAKFKGSVEKIYNLLYTNGFTTKFLKKRYEDVNTGEWTKDDNGKLVRLGSYIKQFNENTVQTTVKCHLKDEVLYQDFDKYVTIITTIKTQDLSSGNLFVTEIRTCIMWADSNTTRIIVTFTVKFSKPSSPKSAIEKALLEGQLEFYKELEIATRKYISHHHSEFDYGTSSALLFSDVDDHHPPIKQNEDTTSNKLEIPNIKVLVLIVLLLTSLANIYILTGLKRIDAKIEFIEGKKGAGNFYKGAIVEFDQICSLNKWLNELKKRQLFSILDESL